MTINWEKLKLKLTDEGRSALVKKFVDLLSDYAVPGVNVPETKIYQQAIAMARLIEFRLGPRGLIVDVPQRYSSLFEIIRRGSRFFRPIDDLNEQIFRCAKFKQ